MADELKIEEVAQFVNWDNLPIALIFVGACLVGLRVATGFLDNLGERMTERRLLLKKTKAMTRFVAYLFIGVGFATTALHLESQAMLALAGTVGVAVGFAFKDLLASLMTGIILLFDQPFQVGDRVSFGGFYGEVTEIGLRSVRLVTLDDNLVTIPNSAFLNSPVSSANAGALDCMVQLDFYISASADFDLAVRLVQEATATSRYLLVTKPVVVHVLDLFMGERHVTRVRSKAYVFDCRFETAYATDITRRVKRAFRRHGIAQPDHVPRADLVTLPFAT